MERKVIMLILYQILMRFLGTFKNILNKITAKIEEKRLTGWKEKEELSISHYGSGCYNRN